MYENTDPVYFEQGISVQSYIKGVVAYRDYWGTYYMSQSLAPLSLKALIIIKKFTHIFGFSFLIAH